MSVTVRPFRGGKGWEVDIRIRRDDGSIYRERKKSPVGSKSGSQRWGEDREKHLIKQGIPKSDAPKFGAVPTAAEFAPRYIDGHLRANRRKPATISARQTELRLHVLPVVGKKKLTAIAQEDIQKIKSRMAEYAPATVNGALMALKGMLSCAVEWKVIPPHGLKIKPLPNPNKKLEFFDFDEFDALIESARKLGTDELAVVMLGGHAGLRRGEMIALEWTSIDFRRRILTIERNEWKGEVGLPKGGKIRTVPMTKELVEALKAHRHLKGPRVFYRPHDDPPKTANEWTIANWVERTKRAANLPHKGTHVLRHTFCSHLAMRGAPAKAIQELAGHVNLATTQRYMHLSPGATRAAVDLLSARTEEKSGEREGSVEK